MTSLHDELAKILKEEKILLSRLYSIVSDERDAIVSLRSDELERIIREKESVIMKLSLWETEREKLLEERGLKGKSLSFIINDIANSSLDKNSHLKEIYLSMKTLLSAIAEIQRINEQLVDRSIIHIGTAIKFLETFGVSPKGTLSKEA